MSFNKVILQGILGADAEVKALQDGKFVMNLRLATTEKWKTKDGEKKEKTDWHSCSQFFTSAPALAQYLTKGKGILIEGKLRQESYEKDGVKVYKTYVAIDQVSFVDAGKRDDHEGGGSSGGGKPAAQSRTSTASIPEEPGAGGGFGADDDIPF